MVVHSSAKIGDHLEFLVVEEQDSHVLLLKSNITVYF